MPQDITEAGTVTPGGQAGNMLIQLITPGVGSSGVYPPEVLEAAATDRVFPAGTLMFADHPGEAEAFDRPERSIRDVAGVLVEDARWDGGALIAEAKTYDPWTAVLAQMADAIGVSIRASARVEEGEHEGKPARIIREMTHGVSVDFVTHAGRGGAIRAVYESARSTAPLVVLDERATTPDPTMPPVNPAGSTTPESQGGTMPQIDEAEHGRLVEAAGRVTALESERDAARAEATEARRELAALRARENARPIAVGILDEAVTLPPSMRGRLVELALAAIPMTEAGAVDEANFRLQVEASRSTAEAEVAEALAAAGAGTVRGNGTRPNDSSVSESDFETTIANVFGVKGA